MQSSNVLIIRCGMESSNIAVSIFVHSYYAEALGNTHTAAYCDYGVKFAAAMSYENLFAVQFHPEKECQGMAYNFSGISQIG